MILNGISRWTMEILLSLGFSRKLPEGILNGDELNAIHEQYAQIKAWIAEFDTVLRRNLILGHSCCRLFLTSVIWRHCKFVESMFFFFQQRKHEMRQKKRIRVALRKTSNAAVFVFLIEHYLYGFPLDVVRREIPKKYRAKNRNVYPFQHAFTRDYFGMSSRSAY